MDYLSVLDFNNIQIGHINQRHKSDFDTEKHDNPVYGNSFDTKNALFFEFANGTGSENTVIYSGKMIEEIRKFEFVRQSVGNLQEDLINKYGEVKAGQVNTYIHNMDYWEGFWDIWLPGLLRGGVKDNTGNPHNNPLVSTKHFLGSYTLTGTVLDDRNTVMWVVADSKTLESLTDHQNKGNSKDRIDGQIVPYGSTYQRYVWFQSLSKKVDNSEIKPTYQDNTINRNKSKYVNGTE